MHSKKRKKTRISGERHIRYLQIQHGQNTSIKKEVSISNLLTNVVNDLKFILDEKGALIITEVNPKASTTVICDDRRIEQVLSNLIKNAINFVPCKEGRIILKVEEVEDREGFKAATHIIKKHFLFTVKDNGEGIPEDKIDNLFEKFYQVDKWRQGNMGEQDWAWQYVKRLLIYTVESMRT